MGRFNEDETKGACREQKQRKRREMRIVGRSVQLLQDIIRRPAKEKRANDLKDLA